MKCDLQKKKKKKKKKQTYEMFVTKFDIIEFHF